MSIQYVYGAVIWTHNLQSMSLLLKTTRPVFISRQPCDSFWLIGPLTTKMHAILMSPYAT